MHSRVGNSTEEIESQQEKCSTFCTKHKILARVCLAYPWRATTTLARRAAHAEFTATNRCITYRVGNSTEENESELDFCTKHNMTIFF